MIIIALVIVVLSIIIGCLLAKKKNLPVFDWAIISALLPVISPVLLLTNTGTAIADDESPEIIAKSSSTSPPVAVQADSRLSKKEQKKAEFEAKKLAKMEAKAAKKEATIARITAKKQAKEDKKNGVKAPPPIIAIEEEKKTSVLDNGLAKPKKKESVSITDFKPRSEISEDDYAPVEKAISAPPGTVLADGKIVCSGCAKTVKPNWYGLCPNCATRLVDPE